MKYALLAAVAACLAAPALAAPAGAFDGPFIGIQGGWQQDRLRLSSVDRLGNRFDNARNSDGFSYGGQVGYDYRLTPHFVLGVEASATGRTGHRYIGDGFGNAYRLSEGRTLDATARLGYLTGPGGLVYVRGGYSNARFDLRDPVAQYGQNRDGYVVGVGYEQALTRQVSARVEYDYSGYGRRDAYGAAFDTGLSSVRDDYRRNAVTAGLNFHF